MARKAVARHGDPTTTGGEIMALIATMFDGGRRLALSEDQATCGNCKGLWNVHGTGKGMIEKGRNVVVHGDQVLCPCKKNRVIVVDNPGCFIEDDTISETCPGNRIPSFNRNGSSPTFDEQVKASGVGALAGYPFFIEAPDGQTLFGRLDDACHLPRIHTGAADRYFIYWGDQALEKQAGA